MGEICSRQAKEDQRQFGRKLLRHDIGYSGVAKVMTMNKIGWRSKIDVANPKGM